MQFRFSFSGLNEVVNVNMLCIGLVVRYLTILYLCLAVRYMIMLYLDLIVKYITMLYLDLTVRYVICGPNCIQYAIYSFHCRCMIYKPSSLFNIFNCIITYIE